MITIEDQHEIEQLMMRYARCADRKDYKGLATVFCPDASFVFMGNTIQTLAGIEEMMHALEAYPRTLHRISNVMYDVEDDSARGETYCVASHLFEQEGDSVKLDMGIIYHDRLRRLGEGWRIAYREFDLLWQTTSAVDGR